MGCMVHVVYFLNQLQFSISWKLNEITLKVLFAIDYVINQLFIGFQ